MSDKDIIRMEEGAEDLWVAIEEGSEPPPIIVQVPKELSSRGDQARPKERAADSDWSLAGSKRSLSDNVQDVLDDLGEEVNTVESSDATAVMAQLSLARLRGSKHATTMQTDESGASDNISDVSSSWSFPDVRDYPKEDDSVAASSTISGFDMISLNGSSMKACKLCSFLNERSAIFCLGCNRALVANPCLSADHEVAKYLQNTAEEQERKQLLQSNLKRADLSSGSLLVRSQGLVDDIESAIRNTLAFARPGYSFHGVPPLDMSLFASRTLESLDRCYATPDEQPFTLCYCFTTGNKNYDHFASIFRNGFGGGCVFGSTPEAAAWAYQKRHGNTRVLGTISEEDEDYSMFRPTVPVNTAGWVVAVVESQVTTSTIGKNQGIPSGRATLYHCPLTSYALPLAYMPDSSVLYDDITRRLVNNLSTTLYDFCADAFPVLPSDADQIDTAEVCAETGDDLALAASLQEMLYEDAVRTNKKARSA